MTFELVFKIKKESKLLMGQLNCIFVVAKLPEHRRYPDRHDRRESARFVRLQGGKGNPTPTPIDYNIVDSSGLSLWVDHDVLMDGAFDVHNPSAEFQFHLSEPPRTTKYWIQPRASEKAVAANFLPNPPQIVMVNMLVGKIVALKYSIL